MKSALTVSEYEVELRRGTPRLLPIRCSECGIALYAPFGDFMCPVCRTTDSLEVIA